MLLPGGDSGLHRAHVAVAAMAGAADRADDNIVDDQREAAGIRIIWPSIKLSAL